MTPMRGCLLVLLIFSVNGTAKKPSSKTPTEKDLWINEIYPVLEKTFVSGSEGENPPIFVELAGTLHPCVNLRCFFISFYIPDGGQEFKLETSIPLGEKRLDADEECGVGISPMIDVTETLRAKGVDLQIFRKIFGIALVYQQNGADCPGDGSEGDTTTIQFLSVNGPMNTDVFSGNNETSMQATYIGSVPLDNDNFVYIQTTSFQLTCGRDPDTRGFSPDYPSLNDINRKQDFCPEDCPDDHCVEYQGLCVKHKDGVKKCECFHGFIGAYCEIEVKKCPACPQCTNEGANCGPAYIIDMEGKTVKRNVESCGNPGLVKANKDKFDNILRKKKRDDTMVVVKNASAVAVSVIVGAVVTFMGMKRRSF